MFNRIGVHFRDFSPTGRWSHTVFSIFRRLNLPKFSRAISLHPGFLPVGLDHPPEVDLERGESDLGEAFTPQIQRGYYTETSAPTEAESGPSGLDFWVLQTLVVNKTVPKKYKSNTPKLVLTCHPSNCFVFN